MKSIKDIIQELNKFPEDTRCEAYEGEANGISLYDKDNKYVGFVYLIDTNDEKTP